MRKFMFDLITALSSIAAVTLLVVGLRSYTNSGQGEGITWTPVYYDKVPGFSAEQVTASVAWDRGGVEFLWMRWNLVFAAPPAPNWRPPVWEHNHSSIAQPLSYEFEFSKDGLLRLGSRIWPLVLVSLVLPSLAAARLVRRRRRLSHGWCEFCGYDLRESRDRCPECGTPVRVALATPTPPTQTSVGS